ncbi:histidine kinase [Halorhabdus amylolytica]|uniref:histidine kinase n=1 Tax=Halorhabdus amylolytica TaxID=2559573 RepID=UPI0010AA1FE7|nr:histidine kinase [Halorhabdus amylolytica]
MSTTEGNRTDTLRAGLQPWQGGEIGGLLGGLVFGVLLSIEMPGVLESTIPGLYGFSESGVIGWTLHMSHAAILGVAFVTVIELGGLDDTLSTNLENGVAGLVYGLVVWVVLAAVVMPIWVSGGGTTNVPNVALESVVGHAAYGIVLGIVYSVLSD